MSKLDELAHNYVQLTEFTYRKKDYKAGYMQAIQDAVEICDEISLREKENCSEARQYGGDNTPGFGMALGALDTSIEIKQELQNLIKEGERK